MSNFTYRAKKQGGGVITGSVAASTESDAVSELRRQGLTVISLKKGGRGAKGQKSGGGGGLAY